MFQWKVIRSSYAQRLTFDPDFFPTPLVLDLKTLLRCVLICIYNSYMSVFDLLIDLHRLTAALITHKTSSTAMFTSRHLLDRFQPLILSNRIITMVRE